MKNIEKLPADFFKDGITPLNGEILNGTIVSKINEIIEALGGQGATGEQKYFNDSAVRYVRTTSGTTRTNIVFAIGDLDNFGITLLNNSSKVKFGLQYVTQEMWNLVKNGSTDPSSPSQSATSPLTDPGWILEGQEKYITRTSGATDTGYGIIVAATYTDGSTGTPTIDEIRNAIGDLKLTNITSI